MRWCGVPLLLLLAVLLCLLSGLEASRPLRRGRFSLGRRAQAAVSTVRHGVTRHNGTRHGWERGGGPRAAKIAASKAARRKRLRLKKRRRPVAGDDGAPAARADAPRRKLSKKGYLSRLAPHTRGRHRAASKRRLMDGKELCLFKALKRCGRKVIRRLSPKADFDKRCSTKERFIGCMSLMQRRGCKAKPRRRRRGPSQHLVSQYQRRLQRKLASARGCVIGVDLSAAPHR